MRGKLLVTLNMTPRPIANKYGDGRLKRTLKREFNSTWVVDVTIVSDTYGDLDTPYKAKVAKYKSRPEITSEVQAETGLTPEFSSLCMSWRGSYSPASAADMRILCLSSTELTFLSAICVEQSAIIHRVHQRSNVTSLWA